MASVSGIQSGAVNYVSPSSPSVAHAARRGWDGDADDGQVQRGSGFASAISQALSQLGLSAPAASGSNASATATQDPRQAISAFMHDLFAALQSQGGTSPAGGAADRDGDQDGTGTTASSGAPRERHGNVQHDLQSLIQQVSAADSTSNSAVAALQNDYQNLLTALGNTGSQTSLSDFLKSVSNHLQGRNPGINVSTTA